jgi:hypothetical protein
VAEAVGFEAFCVEAVSVARALSTTATPATITPKCPHLVDDARRILNMAGC